MVMGRLDGKVAVISGAGSGIARAAARIFTREGARVVVAEIDPELGAAAAREAGMSALFVPTDVTDEASVEATMAQAVEHFGDLHILFNCAGGSVLDDNRVTDVDMAVWEWQPRMRFLYVGPELCLQLPSDSGSPRTPLLFS